MLTPVTHIIPIARIRRERFLPVSGTVVARAGQMVSAQDVVAYTDGIGKHLMIDVTRGLGVSRSEVGDFMMRKVGDMVTVQSVIARKGGRSVRATHAGQIIAVSGGQVMMQTRGQRLELKARLPGKVMEVEADLGIVIETTGAWIQGVWGNGKFFSGPLRSLMNNQEHVVTAKQIDPSQRGSILLAGYCDDRKVLEKARHAQLRGLILGSMSTRLIPIAAQMPFAVIVLDGFGHIPMNAAAFDLLTTNVDRELALNAIEYDSYLKLRPEIIIPVDGIRDAPMPVDLDVIGKGHRVRILRAPYQGKVGTVVWVRDRERLPNSIRTKVVEVEFESVEDRVLVPLANIEVIG